MRREALEAGWHHFNVKVAPNMKYFTTNQGGRQVDAAQEREQGGGIVDGAGVVKVRPVQKFYSMRHLSGAEEDSLMTAQVVTVTEKMDGEMMCGAVRDGQIELWSRGGLIEQARSATGWARENKLGVLTLVAAVWQRGE